MVKDECEYDVPDFGEGLLDYLDRVLTDHGEKEYESGDHLDDEGEVL